MGAKAIPFQPDVRPLETVAPHDDSMAFYDTVALVRLKRRTPSARERTEILEAQKNRCYYCREEFGAIVSRKGKRVSLRLNWDHFVPFSYALEDRPNNFVAACHICNGIKGALVFQTKERAIEFIAERRFQKGYRTVVS